MAEHHGTIVPVIARHDQTVEIHWRLADGKTLVETHTLPPRAVVEARLSNLCPVKGQQA